jgi:hypothetical protein
LAAAEYRFATMACKVVYYGTFPFLDEKGVCGYNY